MTAAELAKTLLDSDPLAVAIELGDGGYVIVSTDEAGEETRVEIPSDERTATLEAEAREVSRDLTSKHNTGYVADPRRVTLGALYLGR